MKELTLSCRSFRIKNITYELSCNNQYQDKPVIACIICIINNESDDLEDSERQIYRFDSQQGVSYVKLHAIHTYHINAYFRLNCIEEIQKSHLQ